MQFVGSTENEELTELAKLLHGVARSVQGRDELLQMVADMLKAYVAKFAWNGNSAAVREERAWIFSMQSQSMNDIVQSYLAVKLNDMIARYEPA